MPPKDVATQPRRLTVDHMLAKVARYLRCLGHDAELRPGETTQELIRRANAEGRVFVTRNTRIEENYPVPRSCVRVRSNDPVEQLREVVRELELDVETWLFSRCIVCNLLLTPVDDRESIRARVPERVFDRYERFWTCASCGTVFWKGSHVRNTCAKLGLRDVSDCADGLPG